ncbi:MAG: ATP-binding cassette domain-containing protein, partial [Rhodobacteraceae bacterium]|nr:ATP-binding cassette domain-containing protein [Paracoccaceae bacterium]
MSDSPVQTPVLEARGVFKTYTMGRNRLEVLHGVDFAVRRGEFVALRGASGAGKSTLLHLLGGLDRPGAGTLRFDNVELNRLSDDDLARLRNRRIGFVFQAIISCRNSTRWRTSPARPPPAPAR